MYVLLRSIKTREWLISYNGYFRLLLGDYYMGLDDQGWIDGSPVTWSNFVDNPSVGTKGVFRVSEVTKWDWNDGIEQFKFICEKRPPPSLSKEAMQYMYQWHNNLYMLSF